MTVGPGEQIILSEDFNGDVFFEGDGGSLDCAGHEISGTGPEEGVVVWEGSDDVVLRNCVLTGGSIGVHGRSATIENNQAVGGLYLGGGGLHQIVGNQFTQITIASDANLVVDNHFRGGGGVLIYADGNRVIGNTATDGSSYAFRLLTTAQNNLLEGNLALANRCGFNVDTDEPPVNEIPSGNIFRANEAYRNQCWAFSDDTWWIEGGSGNAGTWNFYEDNICAVNRTDEAAQAPEEEMCLDLGGGPFIDSYDSTFEQDIWFLFDEGLTRGCDPPINIRYCPDDSVTRGELAVFLNRMFDYTDNGGGNVFIDDDGRFYEDAADRIRAAGITNGCNPPANDRFCGDRPVTRGEFAAMFVRAMAYTDNGGSNLFADTTASIFEDSIDKLATAGVTKGCNPPANTMFCPADDMTRGQLAAFIRRAIAD